MTRARVRASLFDLSKQTRWRDVPEIALVDQLLAAGMPEPEPEVVFAAHLGRKWAFDWAWRAERIALEVEGAMFGGRVINVGDGAFEYRRKKGKKIHVPIAAGTIVRLGGRHNTGAGLVADLEKYNTAAILGWMVIRVTTTDVRDHKVSALVARAFEARQQQPRRNEVTA
jgi:hypothetical protein